MLTIYTDGGCTPNPGRGAWACVLLLPDGTTHTASGPIEWTTNNVAELTAVIEGIKLAERLHLLPNALDEELTIISDSLYVVKGASEWIKKWKANGWLTAYRSKNESVKNVEFWVEIDNINQLYKPTWKWVRGHSGNEYNELCDKMATAVLNK